MSTDSKVCTGNERKRKEQEMLHQVKSNKKVARAPIKSAKDESESGETKEMLEQRFDVDIKEIRKENMNL